MNKYNLLFSVLASSMFIFSGCDSDDNKSTDSGMEEHYDEDQRTLIFYSSTTNDHYAYNVEEKKLLDLNNKQACEYDISNFTVSSEEKGKPFIWLDNKGDDNISNDEQKVIMFKDSYSFDRNITWEDFIYLGHFHSEEDEHHLAAHTNSEFKDAIGQKLLALKRINLYIAEQNALKESFGSETVCGVQTVYSHEEEHNEKIFYVMGTDGYLTIYDEDKKALDRVLIGSSCQSDRFGMSVTEHGVWIYLADNSEIYKVDSHDDGVYHIHSRVDVSDYIGNADAEFMISIEPVE